jgi:hypothetical protein
MKYLCTTAAKHNLQSDSCNVQVLFLDLTTCQSTVNLVVQIFHITGSVIPHNKTFSKTTKYR